MVAAHQALRIQRQCTVVRWCCKRIGAHFTIGADNVKGRCEPPTEEEVQKNLAIAQMKKENAAKLDAKRLEEGGSLPSIPEKGPQSYPKYEEYYSGDAENHPSKRKQ